MTYLNYINALKRKVKENYIYPENRFQGKGIVTLGGGRYFPSAWVNLKMLRHYNCNLPIEFWHYGPEELPEENKKLLMDEIDNIKIIDLKEVLKEYPSSIKQGWPMKPYAIINSSFEEVLFLDADNVVVTNPLFLFLSKEYKIHKTLFWPDYFSIRDGSTYVVQKSQIWQMIGIKPYKSAIESAQLLIHKKENWKPLQVALHMNENSDFYYQHLYGDKDTFLIAWLLTNHDFHLMPEVGDYQHWMLHKDFNGGPLFQHRWGDKWSLDKENLCLKDFYNEVQCKKYLLKLKLLLKEQK